MRQAALLQVFAQPGEQRQRQAIASLCTRGVAGYWLAAGLCLGTEPPSILRWSLEALARTGGRRSLPMLTRSLAHPAMSVRLHALIALESLGDPRLAPLVRPLLRDASGGIRVNALAVLGRMRPRWLAAAARSLAEDEKPYVRRLAATLLGAKQPHMGTRPTPARARRASAGRGPRLALRTPC